MEFNDRDRYWMIMGGIAGILGCLTGMIPCLINQTKKELAADAEIERLEDTNCALAHACMNLKEENQELKKRLAAKEES